MAGHVDPDWCFRGLSLGTCAQATVEQPRPGRGESWQSSWILTDGRDVFVDANDPATVGVKPRTPLLPHPNNSVFEARVKGTVPA